MRRAGPGLRHALLVLLLWPSPALEAAQRLEGQVVSVTDGDTLTVLTPPKTR